MVDQDCVLFIFECAIKYIQYKRRESLKKNQEVGNETKPIRKTQWAYSSAG